MERAQYNVVIIGAGPAGSACAIELLHIGVGHVLLVESGAHEKFRIGESIPPEANVVLRQLGVFEGFLAQNHEPCYGTCSWWGDDRRGYNDTLLSPNGHGWHLDRQRFNSFLAQQADLAGTELLTNTSFLHSKQTGNSRFELTFGLADGSRKTIEGGIVVDASGAHGVFAAEQGSQKINTNPLVCLSMRFALKGGPKTISKLTYLEAVEYGWWYAARLPGERLLVTLYSDVETIKSNQFNQLERLHSALVDTPNMHELVQGLHLIDTKPNGFPAPSFRLDKITGRNWLAVGDAACAYDPITSQGIMKSLTSGMHAAAVIAKGIEKGHNDFSSFEFDVSQRYAQYQDMRTHFYHMEKRWPEARFWRKYQGLPQAVA